MNSLVEFGLVNGAAVIVLAVLVKSAGRWVRRPALMHALWVLVLLKLITPPLAGVPIGVESWFASQSADEPASDVVGELPLVPEEPPPPVEAWNGSRQSSAAGGIEWKPELVCDGPAASSGEANPSAQNALSTQDAGASLAVAADDTGNSQHPAGDGRDGETGGVERAVLVCAVNGLAQPVDSGKGLPAGPVCETTVCETTESSGPLTLVGTSAETAALRSSVRAWMAGWCTWTVAIRALSALWLMGALVWYVRQGWRIYGFSRFLAHGRPAPAEIQAQARQLAQAMGMRRCPQVIVVPGCLSPMLWAIGRAKLLFPAELLIRLGSDARATLLGHELAHYHRGDHWVRVLEFVVGGLYWWHPAVWWARREIEAAEEECCDAWVVDQFPEAPRCYAEALLDTIDFLAQGPAKTPAAASGLGDVSFLKKRLTWIMRGAAPKAMTAPGRLTLAAAALVLLPISPVFNDPAPPAAAAVPIRQALEHPEFDAVDAGEPASQSEPNQPAFDTGAAAPVVDDAGAEPISANNPPSANIPPPANEAASAETDVWAVVPAPDGQSVITAAQDRVFWTNNRTGEAIDLTLKLASAALKPLGRDGARDAAGDSSPMVTDRIVDPTVITTDRIVHPTVGDGSVDPTVTERIVHSTGQSAASNANIDFTPYALTSVAFAPNRATFATGGRDARVRLWNSANGELEAVFEGHADVVRSVAFSSDGGRLASGSQDGVVLVWDMNGDRPAVALPQSSAVSCLRFSPDGRLLAVASGDWAMPSTPGEVALYDVASLARTARFACDSPPGAVVFQNEGQSLAVADWSGRVSFWNPTTGERLLPGFAQRNKNEVSEAQFSPDVPALSDVRPGEVSIDRSPLGRPRNSLLLIDAGLEQNPASRLEPAPAVPYGFVRPRGDVWNPGWFTQPENGGWEVEHRGGGIRNPGSFSQLDGSLKTLR